MRMQCRKREQDRRNRGSTVVFPPRSWRKNIRWRGPVAPDNLDAKGDTVASTSLIRVLLVDDFEPFRRMISTMVQERAGLHLVGEAVNGLEAVQQAEKLLPDLILLDIALPCLNGIEAARRIRKLVPECKILFLSQNSSAELAQEALRLGARGYVIKTDAGGELFAAVEAVLAGKKYVSSGLAERVATDTAKV